MTYLSIISLSLSIYIYNMLHYIIVYDISSYCIALVHVNILMLYEGLGALLPEAPDASQPGAAGHRELVLRLFRAIRARAPAPPWHGMAWHVRIYVHLNLRRRGRHLLWSVASRGRGGAVERDEHGAVLVLPLPRRGAGAASDATKIIC